MKKNQNNYCVILAGGKGRRLWPCSREERPKQFVDFFGTSRIILRQHTLSQVIAGFGVGVVIAFAVILGL